MRLCLICKKPRPQRPMCPWDPNEDPMEVVWAALEDRARRATGE